MQITNTYPVSQDRLPSSGWVEAKINENDVWRPGSVCLLHAQDGVHKIIDKGFLNPVFRMLFFSLFQRRRFQKHYLNGNCSNLFEEQMIMDSRLSNDAEHV